MVSDKSVRNLAIGIVIFLLFNIGSVFYDDARDVSKLCDMLRDEDVRIDGKSVVADVDEVCSAHWGDD